MIISLTGGTGFVGRRLVKVLLQGGHEVRVLTRRLNVEFDSKVQVVHGDLNDDRVNLDFFLEGTEVVFHCAGELKNIEKMRLLHVDGTKRLLQAAMDESSMRGSKVIHWVQLSSVGAYGPPNYSADEDRMIIEDTQVKPVGEYEVTKTESDKMVFEAGKTELITYSIVRPSNVFGIGMPNRSLYHLGKMVRKGLFFYVGKAGAVANYVHVNDVVEVLMLCGFDGRAKGEMFNISNDCLLEEMIQGMAHAMGVRNPRLRLPEFFVRSLVKITPRFFNLPLNNKRLENLIRRTRYPYTKIQKVLGFTPKYNVPESIAEVLQ